NATDRDARSLLVRGFERVSDLPRDGQWPRREESVRARCDPRVSDLRPAPARARGRRPIPQTINRSDGRMIQGGEELCLALGPHHTIWIERKVAGRTFSATSRLSWYHEPGVLVPYRQRQWRTEFRTPKRVPLSSITSSGVRAS